MSQCPNCKSNRIKTGKLIAPRGRAAFKPDGIRFFAFIWSSVVDLREQSYACLDCGLVWNFTDAAKLRELVTKHCD